MSGPGLGGRRRRTGVAIAVFILGVMDVVLAAVHHPIIHAGAVRHSIPYVAVEGGRYALLVSGLALIAVTPGLRHGKRQAWLIAMGAASLSLVAHSLKRTDLIGVGSTIVVAFWLVVFASHFRARSDPLRTRQGVLWLVLGELGVSIYALLGLYFLDSEFLEPTEVPDAIENAFRAIFILPATTVAPTTQHAAWFIDSVRVMALSVLFVATWHLLHPVMYRRFVLPTERERIRALLDEYATNTLAFFHLLDDKSYFYSRDGLAFIGYKVVGHVAVALGEPIGPRDSCVAVAREFADFCELNGWAFAFHQVTQPGADLLRDCGLRALKIGEEAIIPLGQFSLAGKSFKHIRNVTNGLEREGYRAERLDTVDERSMADMEFVSNAWLESGGHRERTFTVGAFDRRYLRETPAIVVRSPEGRIEAFVNVIPSFRSGIGNFDLMRRKPDAPDGVMDLLIVALAHDSKDRGCQGLSLGMAPLANVEGPGVLARALRLLYSHGGRAFNFQGLRAFKSKWKPDWEPRYLCYRNELQIPQIALAVARAGERRGAPWRHRRERTQMQPPRVDAAA